MDMSKAIREGRDRLGMSQEALAERLGVSRQAVSKWEMGTSVPSPENRRALSEILGTDLQVERETAPPVPLRRWKRLTLAAGLLCLALLAALDAAGLTDRVDAIHLDDLSRLTMDYAGRFSVEMPYSADYEQALKIVQGVVDTLETNQTGTIHLDPGSIHEVIVTLD
mgnify:CR=1 FL=1